MNINKFAELSQVWVGGENCLVFFVGSFPLGEKKHINKIPPKIPGQSYLGVFFFIFFRSQKSSSKVGFGGILKVGQKVCLQVGFPVGAKEESLLPDLLFDPLSDFPRNLL